MLKKMIAGALALVALVACSKEQDAPSVDASRTKSLHVTLNASRSEESTRAVFGVSDDGSGAITGLEMPETDVLLRVAVKQGVNGTPVYQTIQFKKVSGRNYATYSGDITVPTGGSGQYFIAAVHMSDVGGKTYGVVGGPNDSYVVFRPEYILAKKDAQGKLTAPVPYATQWQNLSVTGDRALPVNLLLNPIGTLLRMRIKNETGSSRQFKEIRISGNSIGYGGFFSFTEMLENGPLYRPGNNSLYPCVFPEPITVEANGYSDWYYQWVYSRKNMVEAPILSFATAPVGTDAYQIFLKTSQRMPTGSVPLTLVYREGHDATFGGLPETSAEFGTEVGIPKLSLEYLAEAPLNAAGTDFATGSNDVGFFTFDEAQQFKNVRTIAGKKYSMGTLNEYKSILPMTGAGYYAVQPLLEGGLNIEEKSVKIGDVTQDYLSDFVYDRENWVSYAVRFKNSSNYNRTAFRYTNRTQLNGVLAMTIEAVYLGTSTDDITTVSTDKFWVDNASQIVKRVVPLYGGKAVDNVSGARFLADVGIVFATWTSTALDMSSGYVGLFFTQGRSGMNQFATHDAVGVIPFIRE